LKLLQPLLFSFAGWLAGIAAITSMAYLWPVAFPAISRIDHYYGAGPSLNEILALILIIASPAALVGGLLGSRLPAEGGHMEQNIFAALGGVCFALPIACGGLWFFTGW
jgi:hypothetical protein